MLSLHIDTEYSVISPYSVMILLSFASGLILQYFLNIKRGVIKRYALYLITLGPLMSIEGALLLTYITSKSIGLSSLGGLTGMYAAALVIGALSRDKYGARAMFENCTLILPLMYSVAKVGCLLGGCCYGRAYHGPLCVEYTGHGKEGMCVFPVQLAETAVFFMIFIVGMIMAKKRSKNTLFTVFMLSAAAKFILDVLRDSHKDCVISVNQALCLTMMLLVAAAAAVKSYRNKKQPI